MNEKKLLGAGLLMSLLGLWYERRPMSGTSPEGVEWEARRNSEGWGVYVKYAIPGGEGERLLAVYATREHAVLNAEDIA